MSLVGRPLSDPNEISDHTDSFLGPRGLTGLVQINHRDDLDTEEAERYTLYYAKNQSLMLDVEIMLKSLLLLVRR
jgi:lipopolysaccharide/colanic/teichoic acid biosynthesis glycosyltransferase